jgi:hypothetical protein
VQEQDQGEEWNVRYLTFLQEFVCMYTYVCIVDIPVPDLFARYQVLLSGFRYGTVGSVPNSFRFTCDFFEEIVKVPVHCNIQPIALLI